MRFKFAAVLIGILLAVMGQAKADGPYYGGGLKERIDIPAPIPDGGSIAVPAGVPVPEGFTYYLRADLGWSFAGERSYSETGRIYGTEPPPFLSAGGPFTFGQSPFSSSTSVDDVFIGTIGFGAYFTPRLRGDLTLDFRSQQEITSAGTYSYTSTTAETVTGNVHDKITMQGVVGLANLYFDLLPRGAFTPYIGAGVGFVYNDASRTYRDSFVADDGGGTLTNGVVTGSGNKSNVALAGALMAGVSFALGPTWMLDVNYRALYLGGIDVTSTLSGTTVPQTSRVELGDVWEHQVRVGARVNLW